MPIKEELRLEFTYEPGNGSGPSYFVEVRSSDEGSVVNISNGKGATPILSCSPDFFAEMVDYFREKGVLEGKDVVPIVDKEAIQPTVVNSENIGPRPVTQPFASFDTGSTSSSNTNGSLVSSVEQPIKKSTVLQVPVIEGISNNLGRSETPIKNTIASPVFHKKKIVEGGIVIHSKTQSQTDIKRNVVRTTKRKDVDSDPMGAIREGQVLRGGVNTEKSIRPAHR